MFRKHSTILIAALTICAATIARGNDFDLSWRSIDGGGIMSSAGGSFTLGGTIGQPDAGVLIGGDFDLQGGFWAVGLNACTCLSDINSDGLRNGADVQGFLECLVASGSNCGCADLDGVPGIDLGDVSEFVSMLLAGDTCP